MKKTIAVLLCLVLLVTLVGCNGETKIPATNTLEKIAQNYSSEKIEKYNSPYTAVFKNQNNTYDMYIFSSPVQYKQGEEYISFDNRLESASDKNYAFQNKSNKIKLLFPKELSNSFVMERDEKKMSFSLEDSEAFLSAKQCKYTNIFGDRVDAVKYESDDADAVFYPTNLGIRVEFDLKKKQASSSYKFRVFLGNQDRFFVSENDGYLGFHQEKEIVGLFYSSLSKEKSSHTLSPNSIETKTLREENSELITYTVGTEFLEGDNSVKGDASIEFYDNKMPDSTAYSKVDYYPYLSNYYELGNAEKGDGNHFLRMRLNYFMTTKSENIISAEYCVKVLNKIGGEELKNIKMNEVNSQWSSRELTWETKGEVGDEIASLKKGEKQSTYFDITEFVKECVDDPYWIKESYGAMICGDSKITDYLATSDNSLYPPYIKIVMEKEPAFFEPQENINNVEF